MLTEAKHYTAMNDIRPESNADRWSRWWETTLFVLGLGLSFGVMLLFAVQSA